MMHSANNSAHPGKHDNDLLDCSARLLDLLPESCNRNAIYSYPCVKKRCFLDFRLMASNRFYSGVERIEPSHIMHSVCLVTCVDKGSNSWIGNHLVSMLAEARFIDDAKKVFDVLPHRTLCTWNSLIKAYSECGNPHHALILYHRMLDDAFIPNGYTFVALLRVLGELDDLEVSYRIHIEIDKKGLLGRDLYVGSNLVHMYAKRGFLSTA